MVDITSLFFLKNEVTLKDFPIAVRGFDMVEGFVQLEDYPNDVVDKLRKIQSIEKVNIVPGVLFGLILKHKRFHPTSVLSRTIREIKYRTLVKKGDDENWI